MDINNVPGNKFRVRSGGSPTSQASAKHALDVIAAARALAESIGTLPNAIKVSP